MGSLIKLIAGMAIGAGVAVVATKLAERRELDAPGISDDPDAATSGFKERLREAGEAARAARAEREAELRQLYRTKVNDPAAFTPTASDPLGE